MEKVERFGKIAVIIGADYGGWWSTAGYGQNPFDPAVIEWIETGKQGPLPANNREYGNFLKIVWVEKGKRFLITEYDGLESLVLEEDLVIYTA